MLVLTSGKPLFQVREPCRFQQGLDNRALSNAGIVVEPQFGLQFLELPLCLGAYRKARLPQVVASHRQGNAPPGRRCRFSVFPSFGKAFPLIYRKAETMKIATYRRVSTPSQAAEDRYGLARQQADLDSYVVEQGHEVVAAFDDAGYSGATLERPGIIALLKSAASGAFEAVVVSAWDRLARDTMLDGYLRFHLSQHGVSVLSATQDNGIDPASELTQDILRAVAKFERPLLKARLLSARRVKARKGGYAGGAAPFGTYAIAGSKKLHRHNGEFDTLLEMRRLRDAGSTLQQIADAMNSSGRQSRHGSVWRPGTVQTALRGYDRASCIAFAQEAAA